MPFDHGAFGFNFFSMLIFKKDTICTFVRDVVLRGKKKLASSGLLGMLDSLFFGGGVGLSGSLLFALSASLKISERAVPYPVREKRQQYL